VTTLFERVRAALAENGITIVELLGRGGMAEVYLAGADRFDGSIAVKVLRPELASMVGWERFQREIGLAAELEHPNIVPLLESGRADGLPFAVFSFLGDGSVRGLLEGGAVLPERAVGVVLDVARGLSHAHSRGIVHRDVKPENLLMRGNSTLVAVLGIARAIESAAGDALTATGTVLGTPAYMSPEQATGAKELDGRSDIYSLGCVFFEPLTGERLFSGGTTEEIVESRFGLETPGITRLPTDIGPDLQRLFGRMMRLKPKHRVSTMEEIIKGLE
jgi:serine/threonine protein kinase